MTTYTYIIYTICGNDLVGLRWRSGRGEGGEVCRGISSKEVNRICEFCTGLSRGTNMKIQPLVRYLLQNLNIE